jgi:hypothetical protein
MTSAGVISIKITGNGTRQWNSDTKNYEYARGVEVKRKSEYPGINVIVGGSAVYQYTGNGKYSYWKMRVAYNEYEGIPNPKEKEILSILNTDMSKFYGSYNMGRITDVVESPKLAPEPKWMWHSPKSVSFNMLVRHKIKSNVNITNLDLTDQIYEVRLYREDMKGEWKNFISNPSQDPEGTKIISSETMPREKIEKLPTLREKGAEAATKAVIAAGGDMKIPDSGSFQDLVMFLHNLLREGSPEKIRAAMTQLLSEKVSDREGIITRMIDAALNHDLNYKDVYCKTPNLNKSLSNESNFYFIGNIPNTNTMFGGVKINEGYVEGNAVTKWKLTRADIGMRYDDDAMKYYNSFSDKKKLCPND